MVTNVYFPVVGGISTYIQDLTIALREKGIEVSILCYPKVLNRLPRIVRWPTYLGFIFYVSIFAIMQRLRSFHCVLHGHSSSFALAASIIAGRVSDSRAVHTFHSPITRQSLALRVLTPWADEIVYVAEATRDLYRKYGVPPHARETIISGGIDVERFLPNPQRREADDSLHVLFVGRICQEKGVEEAIRALRDVPAHVHLTVVGSAQTPDQHNYLERQQAIVATSDQLRGRVEFTGLLAGDALIARYQQARIFICPSMWEEPAPMVIAEAQSCGLPVLAFDSGGLRARIKHNVDGWLVPRGDVAALAAKICYLSSHPAEVVQTGRQARAKAISEFDFRKMCDKYLTLYGLT